MDLVHRDYSKASVNEIFGPKSSSKLAAEVKRTNPGLYASMKQQAIRDGLLSGTPHESGFARMQRDFDERHKPQQFSPDILRARYAFPEAEVKRLLTQKGGDGNKQNLASMKKNDAATFALFVAAARSYGFQVSDHNAPAKPATAPEATFELGEALRDKFNLPSGHRVTEKEFIELNKLAVELDAAKTEQEQK